MFSVSTGDRQFIVSLRPLLSTLSLCGSHLTGRQARRYGNCFPSSTTAQPFDVSTPNVNAVALPSSSPARTVQPWPSDKVVPSTSLLAAVVLLTIVVAWAYGPTLAGIGERWANDSRYSHGYFVPLFALALLWMRRRHWLENHPRASAWGLAILAGVCAMRLVAGYVYFDWLDAVSLLPCLAGLVVLVGGQASWRWAWPAILYLVFMLPLPYQVEVGLARPLQRLATIVSTYALQTLGYPAVAEGNIIHLEELQVGVLEACSGLGMLVTFFALSAAFALVVQRPLVDRLVLFLSAAPIGVFANLIRVTATVILHRVAGSDIANAVFHDLAGWLMMPLAIAALWLELWLLDRLFVSTEFTA